MTTSIVLHQWEISPFCQKVARTLRYKGLDYSTVNYNGLLGAKVGKLSKVGKVPVLDIDGQRIQDSTRIVRHLEQHHPEPPLYPTNPVLLAQVELWEDWSDEVLYWFEVFFRAKDPVALEKVIDISCEGRSAAERLPVKIFLKTGLNMQLYFQGLGRMNMEDVTAEFLRHLDRIESVLSEGSWLVGKQISIADIAVGSQLLEVLRTSTLMGSELTRRSAIADWLEKISAI